MRWVRLSIGITLVASALAAAGPESSLRPLARGDDTRTAIPAADVQATRPKARPALLESALADSLARQLEVQARPGFSPEPAEVADQRAMAFAALSPRAIGASPRPSLRPGAMVERAMARQREREKGAVCGDPAIQGDAVGYVPGRIRGCGIDNAVQIRSVSGVVLSQQSLMDCGTAQALKRWIDTGVKPAVGQTGGGVSSIRVAAHYACRTRNNQPGARISEHGKGRAIDISAITLKDGQSFTVLNDWSGSRFSTALRQMHRAACGPFGTVLGPNSDRFHRDHFHFDTARYRSGSYCR